MHVAPLKSLAVLKVEEFREDLAVEQKTTTNPETKSCLPGRLRKEYRQVRVSGRRKLAGAG